MPRRAEDFAELAAMHSIYQLHRAHHVSRHMHGTPAGDVLVTPRGHDWLEIIKASMPHRDVGLSHIRVAACSPSNHYGIRMNTSECASHHCLIAFSSHASSSYFSEPLSVFLERIAVSRMTPSILGMQEKRVEGTIAVA